MPPDEYNATGILFESDPLPETCVSSHAAKKQNKPHNHKMRIVWQNVLYITYFHISAVYGLYLLLSNQIKVATMIYAFVIFIVSGLGVTGGAHRLWAHRAFKAKLPLRIFFMLANTMAFEDSVFEWARNHRVHHKFTETDADPHNARRGFFFSHCGWLMVRKHPEVAEKGKTVDLSDLENDKVLSFQRKYYAILMPMFTFLLPTLVPVYLWSETWNGSYHFATMFRYVYQLNWVWSVNSAAHLWGTRPYDKHIEPRENFTVAFFTLGEGWHNYHHVFPWDYRSSELGFYRFNFTTRFIDWCAQLGLAYDLKCVSTENAQKRARRTGDGSYTHPSGKMFWGWDDKDMTERDKSEAIIKHCLQ